MGVVALDGVSGEGAIQINCCLDCWTDADALTDCGSIPWPVVVTKILGELTDVGRELLLPSTAAFLLDLEREQLLEVLLPPTARWEPEETEAVAPLRAVMPGGGPLGTKADGGRS